MRICDDPVLIAELSLDGQIQTVDWHLDIYKGRVWIFQNCRNHRLLGRDPFLNGPHLELDFLDWDWLEIFRQPHLSLSVLPADQPPLWEGRILMLSGYFSKYRGTGEQAFQSLQIRFQRLPGISKIMIAAQLGPCLSNGYNYVWPAWGNLRLSFEIPDDMIDRYFLDTAQNQAYRAILKNHDLLCDAERSRFNAV